MKLARLITSPANTIPLFVLGSLLCAMSTGLLKMVLWLLLQTVLLIPHLEAIYMSNLGTQMKNAFMRMAFHLSRNVASLRIPSLTLSVLILITLLMTSAQSKQTPTTISLLKNSNKIMDSLLAAIETLQPSITYNAYQLNVIHNNFQHVTNKEKDTYNVLLSWNNIMKDVHQFSIEGDQSIVVDGARGTTMRGDIRSKSAFHVCPGKIPFVCDVHFRNVVFDVTHSYKTHLSQFTGSSK
nr:hypothetical protein [Hepelivirales sp.]